MSSRPTRPKNRNWLDFGPASLLRRISAETGILMEWLLENDLNMPLIADHHEPFTVDDYNRRRSLCEMGGPTISTLLHRRCSEKWTR